MEALFIVLGAVLALGGALLSEWLRNRRATRVGAHLIWMELVSNENRAKQLLPGQADLFFVSQAAFEAHAGALAVRAASSDMAQITVAYAAYGSLQQYAHDPQLARRISQARTVQPLLEASKEARRRLLLYSQPAWWERGARREGEEPTTFGVFLEDAAPGSSASSPRP